MTKHFIAAICAVLFLSFTLSSCDTPTGQGAGWGAATGALIGAAATGDAEGAAVGAAIGAATGALLAPRWKQTSAVIMRVDRWVVILTLNERNIRGLSTARTRRTASSTCAAFRMVRLCAILRRAEFSASRNCGSVDLGAGWSERISPFSFADRRRCAALLRPSESVPATCARNFRPQVCASRRNPCANRCFARSARDRANRSDS